MAPSLVASMIRTGYGSIAVPQQKLRAAFAIALETIGAVSSRNVCAIAAFLNSERGRAEQSCRSPLPASCL
jgi:hypothetical protein